MGRRGIFYLFKLFLPGFAALIGKGGGRSVTVYCILVAALSEPLKGTRPLFEPDTFLPQALAQTTLLRHTPFFVTPID